MAIISREKAEAIINEAVSRDIVQNAPEESVFMRLARKLPNMTSKQTRIRVLDLLPTAYWVNGDTGFKQTSEQAWDNVYLNAEELAVIVPIPEAVLDDAGYDIIGEVTPRVREAIGARVDQATIFDIGRPSAWPAGIVARARQAGNNISTTAATDYYEAILGETGAFAAVEAGGYDVTGAVAALRMKAKLRGLRTDTGAPIFSTSMQGATSYALDGAPMYFPKNGAFDTDVAQMVVGDWNQAVYAIRQDITTKILTEGVIQDPSDGSIVYNLAQQDMIALRVVIRLGWALPNPATRLDGDRLGCPFAYIEPNSPAAAQTVNITVVNGSSDPVAGAVVTTAGMRAKTNASGVAVLTLAAGTYELRVKAEGFRGVTDSVTVAASTVNKSITLT